MVLFLRMATGKSVKVYSAVSGKPDDRGNFTYTMERQTIEKKGPIPEGKYWISPSQLQENHFYRIFNPTAAWGDNWITIHPYPSTETYGRGGFFIHGGNSPGSAGCIDLTTHMKDLVVDLNNELQGDLNCYIPLTVQYKK